MNKVEKSKILSKIGKMILGGHLIAYMYFTS